MPSEFSYEAPVRLIPPQWIIVDSRVYDVSKFANLHPGGAAVLLVDSIGNLSFFSSTHRPSALMWNKT